VSVAGCGAKGGQRRLGLTLRVNRGSAACLLDAQGRTAGCRQSCPAALAMTNGLPGTPPPGPGLSHELHARRHELEVEVAGIVCNNPRALEDFHERAAAITRLHAEVESEKALVAAINDEIDEIKVWGMREDQPRMAAALRGLCAQPAAHVSRAARAQDCRSISWCRLQPASLPSSRHPCARLCGLPAALRPVDLAA
jgi:hypothetical protein